jgi:hypothetical protein
MHHRVARTILWAAVACIVALTSGCAHRLGPKNEPAALARELGLGTCTVSETMRRYEVLDFADLIGNPDLAESSEWKTAMSMVQPGDRFRRVHCGNTGDNYFGLFREKDLIYRFGSMLYD